jgi:hypothetical protein
MQMTMMAAANLGQNAALLCHTSRCVGRGISRCVSSNDVAVSLLLGGMLGCAAKPQLPVCRIYMGYTNDYVRGFYVRGFYVRGFYVRGFYLHIIASVILRFNGSVYL